MSISARQLVTQQPDLFLNQQGFMEAQALCVLPPDLANSDSLCFTNSTESLQKAIKAQAPIVITAVDVLKTEKIDLGSKQSLFVVKNISQAMTYILKHFDKKSIRYQQTPAVHPSAFIAASAQLGKDVVIGPHAYIGEGAVIGDYTYIGANAVVETQVKIGSQTRIHPLVYVGAYCVIGNSCEIHPQTSIGCDGYGYAPDLKGQVQKIPQIGNVVIEDFVEIGSGCAIDRATLTSTRIGMGTKLDNLCHIAHNVEIGKGCFLTALFSVAGSAKIGDFCTFGGRSGVSDHVTLANKVTLAGDSIAIKDIPESGAYGGYPTQPLKSYLKNQLAYMQLFEMKKDLNKVLKHLNLDEKEKDS